MKLLGLIAVGLFAMSAKALVIRALPQDITCQAEVDKFQIVYLDIQIRAKTVGQYILDHSGSVTSPAANAALAYCESVTAEASQDSRMVLIDTDANDIQRALIVDEDSYHCRR